MFYVKFNLETFFFLRTFNTKSKPLPIFILKHFVDNLFTLFYNNYFTVNHIFLLVYSLVHKKIMTQIEDF